MHSSQKKSFSLSCPHRLMCFISSSLLRCRLTTVIRSLGTTSSSPLHVIGMAVVLSVDTVFKRRDRHGG
jgi:hypothetical protein